jgi:hypothetical protein
VRHLTILVVVLLIVVTTTSLAWADRTTPLFIDHRHTDIRQVPEPWIARARDTVRVSFGHTSHGSQLVTGASYLRSALSATT